MSLYYLVRLRDLLSEHGRDLFDLMLGRRPRREWAQRESELIAYYLDRLASAGGPRVTLGDAMQAYRLSLPTAFAFWTLTLKPDPAFPDMQPATTARVFIERMGQAMADHAALDAV